MRGCPPPPAAGRGRVLEGVQGWLLPGYAGRMALSGHVPDLGALEVLLSVARAGSLNGAAQQIGVSQQAVSAPIRAMEAQTGGPLVRRSPRRSAPTPPGP